MKKQCSKSSPDKCGRSEVEPLLSGDCRRMYRVYMSPQSTPGRPPLTLEQDMTREVRNSVLENGTIDCEISPHIFVEENQWVVLEGILFLVECDL